MNKTVDTISIGKLEGMSFFIPSYQRGYRWKKKQVNDLLNDIKEFMDQEKGGFYCIQPLVVKSRKNSDSLEVKSSWEVIDGQQRLTTIYLILQSIRIYNDEPKEQQQQPYFSMKYETREGSAGFLKNVNEEDSKKNIDYHHMFEAKNTVDNWLDALDDKEKFKETLLERVKFIWYESVDNSIDVFTRLNVGKIPLTNAELIKALFLRRSNFEGADSSRTRPMQQTIASEWDVIEGVLQDDEFWFFLNSEEAKSPTRIDLIFDLICEKNVFGLSPEEEKEVKKVGKDSDKIFRYFSIALDKKANFQSRWDEVKKYFLTFQEWFDDLEFYHYVGYLIRNGKSISELYGQWINQGSKEGFRGELITDIKKTLEKCKDLDEAYETEKENKPKTLCRPLLLLFNIQSIINQNKGMKEEGKYKMPVFYKFPFHIFSREKWDIEHIDSATENDLDDCGSQKEWLKASLAFIEKDELKNEARTILEKLEKGENCNNEFADLRKKIENRGPESLKEDEKNKIWNFALLDASTNRSYGNAIFPVKRRIIISKNQGKKIGFNDNEEITYEDGDIAFVPSCTLNVFLKFYTTSVNNLRSWTKSDAEQYQENIKETLKDFLG